MPGEEEIARTICASDFDFDETVYDTLSSGQRLNFAINARAVLALFAPILAEKERAELVLCDLMNAAGHYRATLSEDDRDALSSALNRAVGYVEAAAIRAQGE